MIGLLTDPVRVQEIRSRLIFLAWHNFAIRREFAEDIAQTALTTYCEVKDRYRDQRNQLGILVGIFRNKCLEYIDRSVKEHKKLQEYCSKPDSVRENPWLSPDGNGQSDGVLGDVIQREESQLILSALAELRPEAREMFRLLTEDGVDRKGLIERYGLNKNTLDSRLHVFRKELKSLLRKKGVRL